MPMPRLMPFGKIKEANDMFFAITLTVLIFCSWLFLWCLVRANALSRKRELWRMEE